MLARLPQPVRRTRESPIRGWCNRQHGRFWPCCWRFESSPPSCRTPGSALRPRRLAAQDAALSRRKRRFESARGCHTREPGHRARALACHARYVATIVPLRGLDSAGIGGGRGATPASSSCRECAIEPRERSCGVRARACSRATECLLTGLFVELRSALQVVERVARRVCHVCRACTLRATTRVRVYTTR